MFLVYRIPIGNIERILAQWIRRERQCEEIEWKMSHSVIIGTALGDNDWVIVQAPAAYVFLASLQKSSKSYICLKVAKKTKKSVPIELQFESYQRIPNVLLMIECAKTVANWFSCKKF